MLDAKIKEKNETIKTRKGGGGGEGEKGEKKKTLKKEEDHSVSSQQPYNIVCITGRALKRSTIVAPQESADKLCLSINCKSAHADSLTMHSPTGCSEVIRKLSR